MKSLAVAVIAVTLPGLALADHTGVPYKPASAVLVPPPQFNNQMGARYRGKFKRVLASHATIQAICQTAANPKPLACAKFPNGRPATGPAPACTVYIPNNLPPDLYKAVNTHEVGHCMGYRHNVAADGSTVSNEVLFILPDGTLFWQEVTTLGLSEDEEHDH